MVLSLTIAIPANKAAARFWNSQTEDASATYATLSGFKPGAHVTYTITGPEALPFTGKATVDTNGNLIIPAAENIKTTNASLTYNFIIDQDNQTLNILLKHNLQTGDLSVSGSGAGDFTTITIENDNNTLQTRSDWAGLFEENDISDIWAGDEKNRSYKIAFFNANPGQNLIQPVNPMVINVAVPNEPALQNNLARNFIRPMQGSAEQFSVVAMMQAFIIGTFFDAKEQLETQRDLEALQAEALKDYHPSEQMCRYGSYIRSLADTDQKKYHIAQAFNDIMNSHEGNKKGTVSEAGSPMSIANHLKQFKEVYCDPMDFDGALKTLCTHANGVGGTDPQRINKDIDFQRTMESNYTLNVDFVDDASTDDEADIIALAKNLYWPNPYQFIDENSIKDKRKQFLDMHQILAVTNVAQNSLAQQVAMRAQAPEVAADTTPGWAYMKTLLREFGFNDDEDIVKVFGERPSYYMQMDVLTKKIYQNPDFYTNLYDKPANIDRTISTMQAIALMQQRDAFETSLRQEMLLSSLVQTDIRPKFEAIQAILKKSSKE